MITHYAIIKDEQIAKVDRANTRLRKYLIIYLLD